MAESADPNVAYLWDLVSRSGNAYARITHEHVEEMSELANKLLRSKQFAASRLRERPTMAPDSSSAPADIANPPCNSLEKAARSTGEMSPGVERDRRPPDTAETDPRSIR